MTLYRKRPEFYRSEQRVGDSVVVRATDGHSAWWINTMAGIHQPQPLPPQEAAAFLRQAHIDTSLEGLLPAGSEAVFLDRVWEDEGSFFRVRIIHQDGEEAVRYYDSETYLVRKVVRREPADAGAQETVVHLRQYQPVDGVLYSFSLSVKLRYHKENSI